MTPAESPLFLALQTALAGRYSLVRELGRGGMGIVYLAHEVALDRPVALKLLPPALAARPDLRERFLREARTAAKLSHPNIVPIHAVDEAGEFVFFAMAFVDGETLGQRVRSRGPLPPAEAARVLREVAWALAYAHAQGVIHRDVKPDNILLESGSGRALVTDFGIAQVRQAQSTTGVGEVLGTAEFMSPEQASGESVDNRSDLYALGCVGYFILAARHPFEAPTVGGVLAKHISQPPEALGSLAPEAPAKLTRVIERCLAKAPVDRFPNGEALAEALGQTFAVQREIPVPLRVFIKQNREAFRSSAVAALVYLLFTPSIIAFAATGSFVGVAMLGGGTAVLVLAPVATVLLRARRLLRAGYGVEDAQLALKEDVERKREELTFEYGKGGRLLDRVLQVVTYGSLAVTGATVGAMVVMPSLRVGSAWGVFGVSGAIFTVSGLVYAVRNERRRDVWGERWLRFWKSRFGKWLFKAAGRGLANVPAAATATYRPTELAIGLAADHLYEALPKETRASMPDLPQVVRRLEVDAQSMRRRVEELNDLVAQIGDDDGRPGGGQRAKLRDDLRATRDRAHAKMLEAVASLETIRLGLLRMQAGAGTVASVTADLQAARELLDEIGVLAAAEADVERMLGKA